MIDALGGPQRVNNVLSTLNLPPISHKNLKVMERRAGEMIEGFANLSMDQRCREAFEAEKRLVFMFTCFFKTYDHVCRKHTKIGVFFLF